MKKYKAVIFDWDGTAVPDRNADVTEVAKRLVTLAEEGVHLIVITGTSYDNVAPQLLEHIPHNLRKFFLYGVSRGCYTYAFDADGNRYELENNEPTTNDLLKLHKTAFDFHSWLIEEYGYPTDIVFSRENYVKVDMIVKRNRGENLYMSDSEIELLQHMLDTYKIRMSPRELMNKSVEFAKSNGLEDRIQVTSDAKYFEIGFSTKSDNANAILSYITGRGIDPQDCCICGDEFKTISDGIYGSDSYIVIDEFAGADVYDFSDTPNLLPDYVTFIGNHEKGFLEFLDRQISLS